MARVILGATMSLDGFINDWSGSVSALYPDLVGLRDFVTQGIESAIAQAKAAAGERDVTIIGAASIARQCLRAGSADELHVDIMPLLLGGGLRLFEDTGMAPVQLERFQVMELPGGRTHLEFRLVK